MWFDAKHGFDCHTQKIDWKRGVFFGAISHKPITDTGDCLEVTDGRTGCVEQPGTMMCIVGSVSEKIM